MPAKPAHGGDVVRPYIEIRVGEAHFTCGRIPVRLITAVVSLIASGVTWWLSTHL